MSSFTVPTELCQAQFQWTGVQNLFPCGFPALDATNLLIQYTTATVPPVTTQLVPGVHVAVLLDALTGNVSLTPIAMPAPNGTVTVTRITPAVQPTQFSNLDNYQADSITVALDRAMLCVAELKRRVSVLEGAAQITPATFTFGTRQQRLITSAQNLPIQSLDSVLNLAIVAGGLAITLPPFATRGGAPLTFKDIAGLAGPGNAWVISRAAANASENIDGLASVTINVPRQEFTLVPANDGTSTGWSIE
jgi:hypothetical protein